MRLRKILPAALLIVALLAMAFTASAGSMAGYTYDPYGEAVPSRGGYEASKTLTAAQIDPALGTFLQPQDLCVDNTDGAVYVLDSGNNRVVVLNKDLEMSKVLSEFKKADGTAVTLNQPTGIFVAAGKMYIADPQNQQLLVCDTAGNVQLQILRPDTDLLAADTVFAPRKVLADSAGNIYTTVTGVYQGALMFKANGEFDSFFGSNSVEVSAALLLDRFWKNLLSDTQVSHISRYIPEEFTSFDIDERDFLYTVTQSDSVRQKLKKLNPMGTNILTTNANKTFGEQEQLYVNGKLTVSRFTDVAVTESGNIVVLDQQHNRLFEYDSEGDLLFVCGGSGQQAGTFRTPTAVDTIGNDLLVLDAAKNNLTVFTETTFAKTVHEAVDLYSDGLYAEAADMWQEILRNDQNYTLAYISLGKALLADEKFEEAAEYFRLGGDTAGNSDAFKEYRNTLTQKWFPVICLFVVALVGLMIWWYNRPQKPDWRKVRKEGVTNPLHMLIHPMDTAEEIKRYNSGSWLWSCVILVLWFAATVVQVSLTNFRFNPNRPEDLNILLLFLRTIPLFLVWVVANWGVCTLLDGKGRMHEIFITNAYCLIPYTASMFIYTALSHFLVDDEVLFLQWVLYIGIGWSLVMLLGALAGVHDYFAGKTIGSVLLSVLGVLIVVFLILLVASLLQKGYAFVYSIINELLYRIG